MSKSLVAPMMVGAVLVLGVALQANASRARPNYEPQYIFDGQYTAELQQHERRWRLLPLRGEEVDVAGDCASGAALPAGLWFVTPDSNGKLQLEAPSVTTLPDGFPQRIALRSCGEAGDVRTTLFVPTQALDWIGTNAGTVLIGE